MFLSSSMYVHLGHMFLVRGNLPSTITSKSIASTCGVICTIDRCKYYHPQIFASPFYLTMTCPNKNTYLFGGPSNLKITTPRNPPTLPTLYLSSAVRLANGNAFFSLPAIFFLLRSIALSTWLFFMLANCSTSSCFFCSDFFR